MPFLAALVPGIVATCGRHCMPESRSFLDAADALVDAPQGGCGTGAPESSSRSREARKKMKDLVTR